MARPARRRRPGGARGRGGSAPQRAGPASAPAPNAATYYRQAFAQLPRKGTPDATALRYSSDEPPTEDRLKIARKYAKVVNLLRAGSAVPRCDWGLALEKGPELELPELDAARELSSLVSIRVYDETSHKQPAEALDDVVALLVLSRHIGKEPLVLCGLFDKGLTNVAIGAAANVLGQAVVPPEVLRSFRQKLTSLPESLPLPDAWRGEGAWNVRWLHDLEKDDPQGTALFAPGGRLWKLVAGGGDDAKTSHLLEDLEARWADPKVRRRRRRQRSVRRGRERRTAGSDPRRSAPRKQAFEKATSASPLAQVFTASPEAARVEIEAADVRFHLLQLALAVRSTGRTL